MKHNLHDIGVVPYHFIIMENWTEPITKLFAEANTKTGIYIKNQFIAYVCKFKTYMTSIDKILCYIQTTILKPENLTMDGEIRLNKAGIRNEYLKELEKIKDLINDLEAYIMEYKKRHDSEYAWDDHMKRSIFIDSRDYEHGDQDMFDKLSDPIIPNNLCMIKEFKTSINDHISETKREKVMNPYPDGFETQENNTKPYLIQTIHDTYELERNLILYAKIIL